jgi:hypothetical protein
MLTTVVEPSDPILKMQYDLEEYGRRAALEGGEIELVPAKQATLEEHAVAMVEEIYRDEFEPRWIESDRLRDREFERLEQVRPDVLLAEQNAALAVAQQEIIVAELPTPKEQGEVSWVLVGAAVTLLTLSTYPAAHDVMPDSIPNNLALFLAVLVSLSFGLFVALGIITDKDEDNRRSLVHWLALIGGVIIATGLAFFRVVAAPDKLFYAVTLAMLEVGTLVALEGYGSVLRRNRNKFRNEQGAREKEERKLAALQEQHGRRVKDLSRIDEGRVAHLRYVEDRFTRRFHLDQIKASALKAVRAGYQTQVASNKGRLLGAEFHRRKGDRTDG